jgi:hypothetical protein
MVLPFFVESGLLLAMYSRKFGLRLQGKFGNLLKTRITRHGGQAPDVTDP